MRPGLLSTALVLILALIMPAGTVARHLPEMDSPLARDIARDMEGRIPDPVEGVWRVAGEKAVIGVRPCGPDRYELLSIDCEAPAVLPGTVIGYATPTARHLTYDAQIFTKVYDGALRKSSRFLISVADDGSRFTLRQYRQGKSLRLWRLIPYLFRYSVSSVNTRPEDLDGCIRVWPPSSRPAKKIVL